MDVKRVTDVPIQLEELGKGRKEKSATDANYSGANYWRFLSLKAHFPLVFWGSQQEWKGLTLDG